MSCRGPCLRPIRKGVFAGQSRHSLKPESAEISLTMVAGRVRRCPAGTEFLRGAPSVDACRPLKSSCPFLLCDSLAVSVQRAPQLVVSGGPYHPLTRKRLATGTFCLASAAATSAVSAPTRSLGRIWGERRHVGERLGRIGDINGQYHERTGKGDRPRSGPLSRRNAQVSAPRTTSS